jgi:hypothetical protein
METQVCISVVPYLLREYVYVRDLWHHKKDQCHKGSPYSLVSQPQRLPRAPLRGALDDSNRYLYTKVGVGSTT